MGARRTDHRCQSIRVHPAPRNGDAIRLHSLDFVPAHRRSRTEGGDKLGVIDRPSGRSGGGCRRMVALEKTIARSSKLQVPSTRKAPIFRFLTQCLVVTVLSLSLDVESWDSELPKTGWHFS